MIRTPVRTIVAVVSAGNYVEVILTNGRRSLVRATLASIERRLAPHGLARVHRSWLVNPDHVTGLTPDGSGDWTIRLGEVEAPLSRRYREALDRLRGSGVIRAA